MNKEKESFIKQWGLISVIGLLGVIAIGGTTYIALPFTCLVWHTSQCNVISEQFGQVGDLFGGIANPIITFLALIALLYSIKIQKEELEKTSSALKQQNFESTFFNLLQQLLHQKTQIEKIEESKTDQKKNIFSHISDTLIESNESEVLQEVFNSKLFNHLSSYLNTINLILDFIDNAAISTDHKASYAKMLFTMFSEHELVLIFISGIKYTRWKYNKNLFEKYKAFENLMLLKLPTSQDWKNFLTEYNRTAYGNNSNALEFYDSHQQNTTS